MRILGKVVKALISIDQIKEWYKKAKKYYEDYREYKKWKKERAKEEKKTKKTIIPVEPAPVEPNPNEPSSPSPVASDAIHLQGFGRPTKIKENPWEAPVNMSIVTLTSTRLRFKRLGLSEGAKNPGHEYMIVISDGKGATWNNKAASHGFSTGWDKSWEEKCPQSIREAKTIYVCVFDVVDNRDRAVGRTSISEFKK